MCFVGQPFWKSSGRLADGREIIYFDESPGLGRASVPDRRPLTKIPTGADPGSVDWADGTNPPPAGLRWDALAEIGRASCRERGGGLGGHSRSERTSRTGETARTVR